MGELDILTLLYFIFIFLLAIFLSTQDVMRYTRYGKFVDNIQSKSYNVNIKCLNF